MARDHAFFAVSADSLPEDAQRVCPLTGNDEIKLCVDARGAMHDFTPAQGSWPPPRIVWTGRRHARTNDRYNSNLFEWGFVDVRLKGEEKLGAVTHWRQDLHPRRGIVETEIVHASGARLCAESFVHLDRNVVVFHRRYEGLPKRRGGWQARAVWTFCMVGTDAIPYRTTFAPQPAWENGIAADLTADGIVMYRGRIALLASGTARARAVGNRLEVEAPLAADGSVTFCLLLADDLGNDPQLLDTPLDDWMSPPVREINREIRATTLEKPDPAAAIDALRAWIASPGRADSPGGCGSQGAAEAAPGLQPPPQAAAHRLEASCYAGLRSSQVAAWQAYFERFTLELPATEPELRAILDTQIYTIRCSCSRFSLPANPFNSSWGAGYFWDEQFPMLGLMACGEMEMPRRILEWRRRCLPFSARMASGYGARFPACATESGQHIADRNGTNFYEFHLPGYITLYTWLYGCYADDAATWRRYYPLIRECAEFFRHWLLVELPGNHAMIVPGIDVDESIAAYDDGPAMACGAALSLHLAAELADRLALAEPDAAEWRRLAKLASRLAKEVGGRFYSEFGVARVPEPDEPADPKVVEWRRQKREQRRRRSRTDHAIASVSGDPEIVSEWAWGHLNAAYVHANEGRAAAALACLRRVPPLRLDFSALCESCSPNLARIHHPWFTTGAGAFLRTLARMLLVAAGETIRLFPGLPHGTWQDLKFRLLAHGNVEVQVQLAAGVIRSLRLQRRAPGARHCRILVPDGYLPAGRGTGAGAGWTHAAGGRVQATVEVDERGVELCAAEAGPDAAAPTD
jgi:hypothetical protein